jgi:hypothetical protein
VVLFLAIDGGKRNRRMGLLRFGHLASLSRNPLGNVGRSNSIRSGPQTTRRTPMKRK